MDGAVEPEVEGGHVGAGEDELAGDLVDVQAPAGEQPEHRLGESSPVLLSAFFPAFLSAFFPALCEPLLVPPLDEFLGIAPHQHLRSLRVTTGEVVCQKVTPDVNPLAAVGRCYASWPLQGDDHEPL